MNNIRQMKNKLLILIVFTFQFIEGYSQDFASDYIEVYFTQSISQKYQSVVNYPYQTGGSIIRTRILMEDIRRVKLS